MKLVMEESCNFYREHQSVITTRLVPVSPLTIDAPRLGGPTMEVPGVRWTGRRGTVIATGAMDGHLAPVTISFEGTQERLSRSKVDWLEV